MSVVTGTSAGCIGRSLDRPETEVAALRSQGLILLAMHLTWSGHSFTVEHIGERMALIEDLPDGTLWVSTGTAAGHYTIRRFAAQSWHSSPPGPAISTVSDVGVLEVLNLIDAASTYD